VFERFSALDRLILGGDGGEVSLARAEVEGWLAPDGLAALRERSRWPLLLARAIQRYSSTNGNGAP
jgi:hypothetical protein